MTHWDEVVKDLEAKRTATDAALASIKKALASGALGKHNVPMDVLPGALLGLSLSAAIIRYLSIVRAPKSVQEIACGLKDGGVESTSDDFRHVVRTILNQLCRRGKIKRKKGAYAL